MSQNRGATPEEIIESYAADLIAESRHTRLPIRVEHIASLLGIRVREGDHDFAGRIYVERNGQLAMDLSVNDSPRRRRFSCSHEIIHTAFPGFERETRYRLDRRVGHYERDRSEEEFLCDRGAAALLMPRSLLDPFDVARDGLDAVETLADDADVSLEAAANRMVTLSSTRLALLVMEVGHKPADRAALRRGAHVEQRLRVRYAITNVPDLYIPKFKSADDDSVFVAALGTGTRQTGTELLPGVRSHSRCEVEARPYPRSDRFGTVDRVLAIARV